MAFEIVWYESVRTQEEWVSNYPEVGSSTKEVTTWNWWTDRVDFDLKDSKGRVIGAAVSIERSTRYRDPNGFFVRTHSKRDGKSFGAIARSTKFLTLEDAKVGAEKKLRESQKRFARAVAKGDGRQFAKVAS